MGSEGKLTPIPSPVFARLMENGVIRPVNRSIRSNLVKEVKTNRIRIGAIKKSNHSLASATTESNRYAETRPYNKYGLLFSIVPLSGI